MHKSLHSSKSYCECSTTKKKTENEENMPIRKYEKLHVIYPRAARLHPEQKGGRENRREGRMATDKTWTILTPEPSNYQVVFLTRNAVAVAHAVAQSTNRSTRRKVILNAQPPRRKPNMKKIWMATDTTWTILTPEPSKNQVVEQACFAEVTLLHCHEFFLVLWAELAVCEGGAESDAKNHTDLPTMGSPAGLAGPLEHIPTHLEFVCTTTCMQNADMISFKMPRFLSWNFESRKNLFQIWNLSI